MKKRITLIVTAVLAVALVATGIIWYDNTKITIEGYDETEVTTFPLSKEGALMLGEKAIREKNDITNKIIRNVEFKIVYKTEEESTVQYKIAVEPRFAFCEVYHSSEVEAACYVEFMKLVQYNLSICKCNNCGLYFILKGDYDTKYCSADRSGKDLPSKGRGESDTT